MNGDLELDPSDQTGAIGLTRLASKELRKKNYREADQYVERSIQRLSSLDRLHPNILIYAEELDYALRMRAQIHLHNARVSDAELVLTDSIASSLKRLPVNHIQIGRDYAMLGQCLYRQKRFRDSLEILDKAIDVFAKYESENNDYCEALGWYGLSQLQLGQAAEGANRIETIQKTLMARSGLLTYMRSQFTPLAKEISAVLKERGQKSEAEFWESLTSDPK